MSGDSNPQTVPELVAKVRRSHAAMRKHREAMAAIARQVAADNDNGQDQGVNNQ